MLSGEVASAIPPFAVPERRRRPQHGAPVTAAVKCGAVVFECRNLRAVSGFVAGR